MVNLTFPRRIVSLQPSITLTLASLGELDRLVACTKYCADVCPEVTARSITIVQDSWTAQAAQIVALQPDLVLAAVPYQLESLAEILKSGIRVVCLSPKTLADVFSDIELLAALVGKQQSGSEIVERMKFEIEEIRARTSSMPRQLFYCEEWGKPLIHSQPWVAELIEAAGGTFVGIPGQQTTTDAIRQADPEVILAAWCGAGDRVPLEKIIRERDWSSTRAARNGRVFCVADELLNTPAECLLGGLRAIAWALHPNLFAQPKGIRAITHYVQPSS